MTQMQGNRTSTRRDALGIAALAASMVVIGNDAGAAPSETQTQGHQYVRRGKNWRGRRVSMPESSAVAWECADMAIFEVESWHPREGKADEHDKAMKEFLEWVKAHRSLFTEWKSLRYMVKEIAGQNSDRHFIMWEYEESRGFRGLQKAAQGLSGAVCRI